MMKKVMIISMGVVMVTLAVTAIIVVLTHSNPEWPKKYVIDGMIPPSSDVQNSYIILNKKDSYIIYKLNDVVGLPAHPRYYEIEKTDKGYKFNLFHSFKDPKAVYYIKEIDENTIVLMNPSRKYQSKEVEFKFNK